MTLRISCHEEKEWKHEIHDQVSDEDPAVRSCILTLDEVNSFFRKVGIIDQHELVKPEVRPEDTEREYKFSKIVKVVRIDHLEITGVFEERNDQSDCSETC